MTDYARRLEELEFEYEDLREENERLMGELGKRNTRIKDLAEENERLKDVVSRCDVELDSLNSEVVDLQACLSAAEEEKVESETEAKDLIDDLQARLSAAEEENGSLKRAAQWDIKQHARFQARLSTAEQQAQSNARAYEDWKAAADERDRLQSRLSAALDHKARLESRERQLVATANTYAARLSAAEEERDQLRADRRNWPCHPAEELQARLSVAEERLRQERNHGERMAEENERQAMLLAGAYDNSGAYVAGLQDRLREAKSGSEECRKAVSERDRLREENHILRDEIADLMGDGFPVEDARDALGEALTEKHLHLQKVEAERDRLLVGAQAVIARRERINKALGYEFVGEYFGSPRGEQR